MFLMRPGCSGSRSASSLCQGPPWSRASVTEVPSRWLFPLNPTFVLILRKVRSFVGSSSLNMVLAWSTRLLSRPLYWTWQEAWVWAGTEEQEQEQEPHRSSIIQSTLDGHPLVINHDGPYHSLVAHQPLQSLLNFRGHPELCKSGLCKSLNVLKLSVQIGSEIKCICYNYAAEISNISPKSPL